MVVGVIVALAFMRMTRERFLPLEANPVSRGIASVYTPALRWVLNHKKTFFIAPLSIFFFGMSIWLGIGTTLKPIEWIANLGAPAEHSRIELDQLRFQTVRRADGSTHRRLVAQKESPDGGSIIHETRILSGFGREFIPPLDEGSFLYMPSLLPQASLGQAIEVNAKQDLAMAGVPEVESVVILKPESAWRRIAVPRWFSGWPGWAKAPLAFFASEDRQISKSEILTELQERTAIPGVLPTFLQPIQTRLIMLQTGFRAMMGVKIYGSNLKEIEKIGLQIESLLKEVPGATDIVADRIVGKPYLEFETATSCRASRARDMNALPMEGFSRRCFSQAF